MFNRRVGGDTQATVSWDQSLLRAALRLQYGMLPDLADGRCERMMRCTRAQAVFWKETFRLATGRTAKQTGPMGRHRYEASRLASLFLSFLP